MKVKFLPVRKSGQYSFDKEVITVHYDGQSEDIDLSDFPEDALPVWSEPENVDLARTQIVRGVERIEGELHVTLCQQHPRQPTRWEESDWIDAGDYEPETLYVKEIAP